MNHHPPHRRLLVVATDHGAPFDLDRWTAALVAALAALPGVTWRIVVLGPDGGDPEVL